MDDETPPLISAATGDASTASLVAEVKQLAADGRALLEAELTYQKSRAALAGKGVKGIAIAGVLALVLAYFALMALVMGLLLALNPLLGGWGALAAVVLGLLLVAGLCGLSAARQWKRMSSQLASPKQSGEDAA